MTDVATQVLSEPAALPETSPGNLATNGHTTSPDAVLARLRLSAARPDADWKRLLLQAIADWPLPSETVDGVRLDYLIGGEAFDWRLLATRLSKTLDGVSDQEAVNDWLTETGPSGGFSETEFTRLLGAEKHRGHLSFLYGVLVERALLAAIEQEVTKRRVASGQPPTERARDEAFERLYEATQEALWAEFLADEKSADRGHYGPRHEHLSLGDVDAFTYWLFKHRLKRAEPARLASDTRKGLNHLERMRSAHERRLRELMLASSVDLAANGAPSRTSATRSRLRSRRATEHQER